MTYNSYNDIINIVIIHERNFRMTVPIQIRIDSNIKKQATELFESLVLDISTAVNIFLYQCVLRGGLPFKIEKPYYNDEVIEAMAKL